MTLRNIKSIKRVFALTLGIALAIPNVTAGSVVNATEPDEQQQIEDAYKDEGFTLAWHDEFDGSSLNLEDWNVELHDPGWVNKELQSYTDIKAGNIEVKDGALKIYPKAKKNIGVSVLRGRSFNENWSTMVADWGSDGATAKGSITIADGKAIANIEDPGNDTWHVQIQQTDISIEKDHQYLVSLKASSTSNRKMNVAVVDPEQNYKTYGSSLVDIGAQEKEVTFEFTADDSPKTIALQINLGLFDNIENSAPGTVTLSDVSFLDLSAITEGEVNYMTDYSYTSGRINTQNKHDFTYGRFEARAKVPTGKGYLPAFWLMATDENNYGQWPKCGEIDIMEVMGQDTKTSYHTVHFGNPQHSESQGKKILTGEDSFADYHVFRVDWEPGLLSWYVDGELVHTESRWASGTDEESQLAYPAPFDQDFYVILNLAIGGEWVKYPDQTTVDNMAGQSYDVDYVRVYRKDDSYYAEKEQNLVAPEPIPEVYRDPVDGNYVYNGNFANDIKIAGTSGDNFELHLEEECKNTQYEVKNNEITITPDNVGDVAYSVQLRQDGIPLIRGYEYKLTFDASADVADGKSRKMIVDFKAPDRGWGFYLAEQKEELTNVTKTFTHVFTMSERSDPNTVLEFNLGNQGSTAPVHISNVRLERIGGEEIVIPDKTVRADGNYVYNGKFDQGDDRLGYWEYDTDDADNISVTNSIVEGERVRELRVMVEAPADTSEANPVVLSQSDLAPLLKGKYDFSFDAYMDGGYSDGLTAVLSGTEYYPELKETKESFVYEVKYDEDKTREESNIEFRFTKPGTYYLDNVMVCDSAILKNGSFNAGLAGFDPYIYNTDYASYVIDNMNGNDNTFAMNIKTIGSEEWHIQLIQDNIKLQQGKKYRISFKAKATIERPFKYAVQRNGNLPGKDWTNYSTNPGNDTLTTEWQTYTNEFEMTNPSDNETRFSVTLGKFEGMTDQMHDVYIDDIVLEEIDEFSTPEPTPTATPTAEPTATPTAEPSETPSTAPTSEPTQNPEVTPSAQPTESVVPTAQPTESVAPTADPSATVAPSATPTSTPTAAPSVKAKDKKTTFSIKNKAKVNKTAKIKIKDKDKIKKITLNGKKIKIKKNKTSFTLKLKSYKKYLKKKGKMNKIVVTDKKGNKKTIKFTIK
ncbi:MAG: carbohydrate binding domain-containing protein [Eubacterium sp.]|nr:carbohydrate binding domain-containing protein [Eubacterium sp.]